MKIRAHHLLCMKYFKGKGYSAEFVFNFKEVINKLNRNPNIKVINSADAICKVCPHLKGGKCMKKPDSEEKVKRKDDNILRILGLRVDQEVRAKNILKRVDLNLSALRKTCKNCEWKEYCK